MKKTVRDTMLVAKLNDLLQLDTDAVQAYAVVIAQLESKTRKQTVRRYQADHKRHVTNLKKIIRQQGGAPVAVSHIPTGPFKLAMQAAMGSLGGDKAVLLAFKSNERQVRDKYLRAAADEAIPTAIARVVKAAAADEERHYRWVEKTLQQLGAGRRTVTGRVAGVLEVATARTVDVIEDLEKPLMVAAEGARRVARAAAEHPVRTAAVAAAVVGAVGAAESLRSRR